MNIFEVIRKPLVTEKTTIEKDNKNVITLVVDKRANKLEISSAVKELFKVEVTSVNTINVAGKFKRVGKSLGRRCNWKKAYVTLKEGSSVDFFEV